MKTAMTELQRLIKSLEKKAEKSKNEFLAFKAARDKACNSFICNNEASTEKTERYEVCRNMTEYLFTRSGPDDSKKSIEQQSSSG